MTKISTYQNDQNISENDIVIGSDAENNKKTKNFSVGGLKSYITKDFEASEQDNKIKSLTLLSVDTPLASATVLSDAANRINNLSPDLTINSDEIYYFKFRWSDRFYVLTLKDLGKGVYGANQNSISENNIQVISEKPLVVENVSKDSTTRIIGLREIQPLNISQAVNNITPAIDIQPLADGFTIFTVLENAEVKSYLFQGNSGLTGFGEQQTTLSNFDFISQTGFETGDPIPEYLLQKDDNDLVLEKDNTEVSRIDVPSFAFSQDNVDRLKDLVYEDGTISLNRVPSTFERNLTNGVSVTFTYGVTLRDDTLQSATFDGNDVTLNPNGSETFTNVKTSLSKSLSAVLTNSSTSQNRNLSLSRSAVSIIPQWKGSVGNNNGFNNNTYAQLNSSLSKILQSSATTNLTVSAGDYGVFLSTKNNASIIELGTGFALSESAFSKQTISVEYEDGTALSLTQYIVNTSNGVFTYRLQ